MEQLDHVRVACPVVTSTGPNGPTGYATFFGHRKTNSISQTFVAAPPLSVDDPR